MSEIEIETAREPTPDAPLPAIGDALRRARSARSLTIEQVAMELRIEPQQLRALEEDRFDAIGPPVFVKGYLRHYSLLLGLDPGELVERYQRIAGERVVELQPSRTIKLRNERQITLWVFAAVALAAVVAVLVLWWRGEGLTFLGLARGAAALALALFGG